MTYRQIIRRCCGVAILAISLLGCEDPEETFDPVNPNLTTDNVVGTIESTARTLNGAERQLSLTMNELIVPAEIATDNYQNVRTFYNQFLDDLEIDPTDSDIRDLQFDIARLRALTKTGLEVIAPADEGATDEQIAGFQFLQGMSYLLAGEYFTTLPAEPGGPAVSAEANLATAIDLFGQAMATAPGSEYALAAQLGRARANYRLGNRSEAVQDAQAVIDADADFVYFARFDGANDSSADDNAAQDALFDRGSFDDLQPAPYLDRLDPKYNGSTPSVEVPVPVLKVEEAFLILAEAALAEGDVEGAKGHMNDLLDLVETRPTQTFNDSVEDRPNLTAAFDSTYADILVSRGGDAPFMDSLILNRQGGLVTIPTVSGTIVTQDEVDDLNDIVDAYELLYLLRQNIFIAEGRRMTDLGIKFVVAQREADANPNIQASDLTPVIPGWLLPIKGEFDDYIIGSDRVEMVHNLTQLTIANRESDLVVPFE